MQPYASAPTVEALRAFLNLDLLLECDGEYNTVRTGRCGMLYTIHNPHV
jgi:hypothetical protein